MLTLHFPKLPESVFCAMAMGISTSGKGKLPEFSPHLKSHGLSSKQLEEYASLTPAFLSQRNMWTKELQHTPPIDDTVVKKYLVNTNVLSKDQEVRYEIQRPFQMMSFIHSMRIDTDTSETFVAIEAQCLSSQSGAADNVKAMYIILDKITGQPYGAYCTCTVGLFQSCVHVGGCLFQLADLVSRGYTRLSDDPSCTEKLCSWTDPKAATVQPKKYNDIQFTKKKKPLRRTVEQYGSAVYTSSPTDRFNSVLGLRQNLFNATQHMGQHVSAVSVLCAENFGRQQRLPPVVTVMPSRLDYNSSLLTPCEDTVLVNEPCNKVLPEAENIKPDNSDASVGCECPCNCDSWSCWRCANYNQDMVDEDGPWFCMFCVRNCPNVYMNV
ncbi:uncharacterized protein KZ484_018083 [Pholidichthys leucotaenia]